MQRGIKADTEKEVKYLEKENTFFLLRRRRMEKKEEEKDFFREEKEKWENIWRRKIYILRR